MKTKKPKGFCQGTMCGGIYPLRKDGLIPKHTVKALSGSWPYGIPVEYPCPYGEQPPREVFSPGGGDRLPSDP